MRIQSTVLTAAFVLAALPASANHRSVHHARKSAPAPTMVTAYANDLVTPGVFEGTPQSEHDVELQYRVESRFGRINGLDSSSVQVRSVRGAITLTGAVANMRAHDQVLFAAASTDGVQVVRDELAVTPTQRGGGPTGAPLADEARARVAHDPGVVGEPLHVDAQGSVIVLRGHVATFSDAERVIQSAKAVPGVTAVRPELTVNQGVVINVDGDRNNARSVPAPATTTVAARR